MKHHCILLLFSGLMMLSFVSCTPALSSPPGDTRITPPPIDKPMTISPSTVPLSPTQPSGTLEKPDESNAQVPAPVDRALQPIVIQAREDLARRLGIPIDSITVDAVIGQEFSTDAFYCRTSKDRISKDESPQVISGQSILLSASAHRYEYHASGQTVVFCRPLL